MSKPSQQQINNYVDTLVKSAKQCEADWLDAQMRRILTPEWYAKAGGKSRARMQLSRYLQRQNIVIREYPNGQVDGDPNHSKKELWMNDACISVFHIRINKGKVEIMTHDFPLAQNPDSKDKLNTNGDCSSP